MHDEISRVKPIYKGHSREHQNVFFLNIQSKELYVLFVNRKIRLLFIDSDVFYRGAI
jgi:hypothetical protein